MKIPKTISKEQWNIVVDLRANFFQTASTYDVWWNMSNDQISRNKFFKLRNLYAFLKGL